MLSTFSLAVKLVTYDMGGVKINFPQKRIYELFYLIPLNFKLQVLDFIFTYIIYTYHIYLIVQVSNRDGNSSILEIFK